MFKQVKKERGEGYSSLITHVPYKHIRHLGLCHQTLDKMSIVVYSLALGLCEHFVGAKNK